LEAEIQVPQMKNKMEAIETSGCSSSIEPFFIANKPGK